MTERDLYIQFRKELDELCVDDILDSSEVYKAENDDGDIVSILVAKGNYIIAVYTVPSERRKGYGRMLAEQFVKNNGAVFLHVINRNKKAKVFWESVLSLQPLEHNEVDTRYFGVMRKDEK